MHLIHNVQSTDPPLPTELNIDTAYERFNIHQIPSGYEYDEKQYDLLEYFRLIIPKMQNEIEQLKKEVMRNE